MIIFTLGNFFALAEMGTLRSQITFAESISLSCTMGL